MVYRHTIINWLIKKHNYKTYLEIGTQADVNLLEIKGVEITGVDPAPQFENPLIKAKRYYCTSESFFRSNKEKFDIIFIDGLHTHRQSLEDFYGALLILNEGGTIVMHDCNPPHAMAASPRDNGGEWCGEVYRSIIDLRSTEPGLAVTVIDADYGVGIIRAGNQQLLDESLRKYDLSNFFQNRKQILNLVTWDEYTTQHTDTRNS